MTRLVTAHTLPAALEASCSRGGQLSFHSRAGRQSLTATTLRDSALARLAALQTKGVAAGDLLVLQVDSSPEFLVSWWACLLGGIVVAPLAPALGAGGNTRLRAVHSTLGEPWILHDEVTAEAVEALGAPGRSLNLTHLAAGDGSQAKQPAIAADDLAYLQFSSGSTSTPKGVVLTHANVLHNVRGLIQAIAAGESICSLSWMPLSHDMGLVGFHLAPLLMGGDQHHLPSLEFVRRPERWLQLAVEVGATTLAATGFALRHTLRRLERSGLGLELDLSGLRQIVTGAEPIPAEVCAAFQARLAPVGLRANAIQPAYGLAEATLCVSVAPAREALRVHTCARGALAVGCRVEARAPGDADALSLVECGAPLPGVEVRVVDDQEQILADGHVGHFQLRGPNLSPGYWSREGIDRSAYAGEGWFDTGDLGFLAEGRLVVAGRTKEVVFLNGQTLYLHDLDAVALQAAEGRLSDLACTAHPGAAQPNSASQILVFVRHRGAVATLRPLARHLRAAMKLRTGLEARVVPVRRVPRTTSGKPQRYRLTLAFEGGDHAAALADLEADFAGEVSSLGSSEGTLPGDLLRSLLEAANAVTGLELDPDVSFMESGASSLALVEVAARVEESTGRSLDVADLLGHPTPRRLARFLAGANSEALPSGALRGDASPIAKPAADTQAIAVVGLSARTSFGDVGATWAALLAGRDAVSSLSAARRADLNLSSEPREGAFLPTIDAFDPEAFGLSETEAAQLHPAHRLLLELSLEAIHDAGLAPKDLAGREVGVYLGGLGDVEGARWYELLRRAGTHPTQAIARSLQAFSAGRLAHHFDLRGPALVADTACSASLVAVHLACQALRAGECEQALVAAARVDLEPGSDTRLGIESPSARARAFSADADGTVLGEGGGALLLKPLAAALRAGDAIQGVIRASAVNHDGHAATLIAPNPAAQRALLERAWSQPGVERRRLAFVEAHGTGTRVGDAVELQALSAALGEIPAGSCALGSLKSNLGHLFEAAGILGLIKSLVALREGRLPATLHAAQPSEHLGEGSPLRLANQSLDLGRGPVQAGVSSFGISGTNAHVVVESAPAHAAQRVSTSPTLSRRRCWPLVRGAATPSAPSSAPPSSAPLVRGLEETIAELRALIEGTGELDALAADPNASLYDAGLDSIVAVQVAQLIEAHFAVELPGDLLYDEDQLTLHGISSAIVATSLTSPAATTLSRPGSGTSQATALTSPEVAAPLPLEHTGAAPLSFAREQQEAIAGLVKELVERTGASRDVAETFRPFLALNRNVAGFRSAWKDAVYPLIADRAQGAWLFDRDGNRTLDLSMGFGVYLFGHAPEFVNRAIAAELERGTPLGPMNALAGEVAQGLSRLTGCERVAFMNTGSEAVMVALRLARAVSGRDTIAIFRGSYHGTFDGVLAVPRAGGPEASPAAPGTPAGMVQDVLVLDYDSEASLQLLRERAHELAAVLVEPVQSRRPELQPREFLRELRTITREAECALVFDEVITGLRCAPGGAQELFEVEADLSIYGKVAGGGMPIGIVAGEARYLDALDGGSNWTYGDDSRPKPPGTFMAGTFCHHPLAMAAARSVLEHLETEGPDLQRELNRRTTSLCRSLNRWFEGERAPIRATHFGSLFRLTPSGPAADLFFLQLLLEGVFVWEGRTCFLSTAHGDQDLAFLEGAIRRAVLALRRRGLWPQPADAALVRLPLTSSQRRAVADDDTQALVLRLRGPLERESLEDALGQLCARHPILCATGVFGHTLELGAAPSIQWDLASGPEFTERVGEARASARLLAEGGLVQVLVSKEGPDDHRLALIGHRVATDGWSLGVVLHELAELYSGRALREEAPLWSELRHEIESVWSATHEAVACSRLPLPKPSVPQAGVTVVDQELPVEHGRTLQRLARQSGVTSVGAWLGLLQGFLAERLEVDEVTIGVPLAGQARVGALGLVGPCSEVIPVEVASPRGALLGSRVRSASSALRAACRTPRRAASPSVVFNLDRVDPAPRFRGLSLDYESAPSSTSRYPLVVNVVTLPDRLVVEWKARRDALDSDLLVTWAADFAARLAELEVPALPPREAGGDRRSA